MLGDIDLLIKYCYMHFGFINISSNIANIVNIANSNTNNGDIMANIDIADINITTFYGQINLAVILLV